MKTWHWPACLALAIAASTPTAIQAAEEDSRQRDGALLERLEALEKELQATRKQLDEIDDESSDEESSSKDYNELGGSFWTNFAWRDYSETSKSRGGDFRIDPFRLDVNGREGNVIWSAQHRWYQYMDVIHHAWVGYQFDEETDMAIGISQVPFGIQPYASHSYWFGVPYYVGLEDDYDTGVRYRTKKGNWDIQLGFYSNPEYANPGVLARYSFDIVSDGTFNNEEINQGNVRLAYDISSGDDSNTELGLSVRRGQLYNSDTELTGDHWAAAVHFDGDYGPWGVELEAIRYEYAPEYPAGVDPRKVANGAFTGSYIIAAEADLYVANLSRDFDVDWGPISGLRCYSDYSVLKKDPEGWEDTELHTLGCGISAGSVYTFVDFIRGKNHHFLGTPAAIAFAEGEQDPRWKTRFNINIEVYF
ncbi:MAG: porin [Gammaproteobacteria bacterium]|nr:porin [Gammaproteobacteria bacterium]